MGMLIEAEISDDKKNRKQKIEERKGKEGRGRDEKERKGMVRKWK